MISIDTSVWIEFFRRSDSPERLLLAELIDRDETIGCSPLVLTEVLRGIPDESDVHRTEDLLLEFRSLELSDPGDFLLAADMYRAARRAGHTIRSTIDCLIAASCVRTGTPLLHCDADFDRLALCTPLQIHRA